MHDPIDPFRFLPPTRFILDENRKPVPCPDVEEWKQWMEPHKRVALDEIGEACVSTVFLGDSVTDDDEPEFFETMVFGGPLDQEQWRYVTYAEAVAGHRLVVKDVLRINGGKI